MKAKAYIHVVQYSWASKPTIAILSHDASDSEGFELLEIREIEVDLPADFNPTAAKIRQLEKQKKQAMDDFNAKIAQINDQISQFQCLEMTP